MKKVIKIWNVNTSVQAFPKQITIALMILIFMLKIENTGMSQPCQEMYPPSFVETTPLDCEGQFEICLVFNLPADFYTLLYFNEEDFQFSESDFFHYIDENNGVQRYGSNPNLIGWWDFTSKYCFTGYNLVPTDRDITLYFEFFNDADERCYTKDVVLKEQRKILGNENLSDLINSTVLLDQSEAEMNSQVIYLDGTLTIDEDYEFGRDPNSSTTVIHMAQDAKIVVENGIELIFDGTIIKSCGAQWDKIELLENSTLLTQGRGTRIDGGKYGVYMHEYSNATLNHVNFINNEWAIFVPPETPLSVQLKCFGLAIDGGMYSSTAIGIEASDLPLTTINNISFRGPIPGQFKNLVYGIKAFNSNITLYSPTMENI